MLPTGGVRLGLGGGRDPGARLSFRSNFFFSRRFNTTLQLRYSGKFPDNHSEISAAMGPNMKNMKNMKKRKLAAEPRVEEINFDSESRQEWLTGFHKRKVQRAKHAADNAAKQYKEDKKAMRKKV